MGVGGQRHIPAAFTPGKDAVPIVQEAGWAPGPVWTGAENLAPTGIRSPDAFTKATHFFPFSASLIQSPHAVGTQFVHSICSWQHCREFNNFQNSSLFNFRLLALIKCARPSVCPSDYPSLPPHVPAYSLIV